MVKKRQKLAERQVNPTIFNGGWAILELHNSFHSFIKKMEFITKCF